MLSTAAVLMLMLLCCAGGEIASYEIFRGKEGGVGKVGGTKQRHWCKHLHPVHLVIKRMHQRDPLNCMRRFKKQAQANLFTEHRTKC